MTQPQIILKVLGESGEWTLGYFLERVSTPYGWLGNSGMRRCRELYEEGLIERRVNGRFVEYRLAIRNEPQFAYKNKETVIML